MHAYTDADYIRQARRWCPADITTTEFYVLRAMGLLPSSARSFMSRIGSW